MLTRPLPFGIRDGTMLTIKVDKAGRVILPQHVRHHFHLSAGDCLDLEIRPDGILLRSRSERIDLVEENGLLVHEGEPVGDLAQAVELARTSRDADVLGLRR
jgi:AbrB family looped-hinge helix DNA binding protein